MKRTVYERKDFRLEEFSLGSGKKPRRFVRITGYNSVAIVPIIGKDRIILERQFRHVIGRYIYEIRDNKTVAGILYYLRFRRLP